MVSPEEALFHYATGGCPSEDTPAVRGLKFREVFKLILQRPLIDQELPFKNKNV